MTRTMTSKTRGTLKALQKLTAFPSQGNVAINVYGPMSCRLWYSLRGYGYDYDLEPENEGQGPLWNKDEGSEEPEWWPWFLRDFELQTALNISYFDSGNSVQEHGREWRQPWRNWALEEGIAPGQLFCVEVPAPGVTKSGYYEVEWEVEWDATVLEKCPLHPRVTLKRWEHDLRRTSVLRRMDTKLAERNAALIDADVGSMYVQQILYDSTNRYEDWNVPSGRAFRLATRRKEFPSTRTSIGVEGRADDGNLTTAWTRFVENACRANPRLSPEVIETLELVR